MTVVYVYALAFATTLAFGVDPASQVYDQDRIALNQISFPSFFVINIDR